jgi:hypothetical protein
MKTLRCGQSKRKSYAELDVYGLHMTLVLLSAQVIVFLAKENKKLKHYFSNKSSKFPSSDDD